MIISFYLLPASPFHVSPPLIFNSLVVPPPLKESLETQPPPARISRLTKDAQTI